MSTKITIGSRPLGAGGVVLRRTLSLVLVCAVWAGGCGAPVERGVVERLVERLPAATADGGVAEVVGGGRAIALPWSAEVSFFLRLPANSELSLNALRPAGSGSARLHVAVETDEDGERRVGSLAPGKDPQRLELVGDRPGTIRLSLRAEPPTDGEAGRRGLVLVEPVIDAPVVAAETPSRQRDRTVSERPNIIIYLVDTLRADRLGCYGYPKPVSPEIDRFASRSTLFERAVANSSWTRPAVASLFTGLWPVAHGVERGRDKLSPDAVTLAEILSDVGYSTASIVANPNAGAAFGLDQGFDHHRYKSQLSDWVYDQAVTWLADRSRDQPFLLYLHTKDPHDPYDPPAPFRERFAADVPTDFPTIPKQGKSSPDLIEGFERLYDGDIAYNDSQFGRLVELLEAEGLYDDSLIIFLADHGEEFQEHGSWLHGTALWAEQIDMPLLVKLPGQNVGKRVTMLAQQIDILPTILDHLGLPPRPVGGRSLLPALEGEANADDPWTVFTHLRLGGPKWTGAMDGRWKLIERHERDRIVSRSLFDLSADPTETDDLAAAHPVTAGFLSALTAERLLDGNRLIPGEAVLTEEELETLRALGYLQ